ncbi:MAG: hypothetical protein DRH89_07230 [Candidatus Cloacimonadota bacterium]|nr:MAG: hypothetical protein DRH89_07230 [Candidatus Cloacimonadota bacterium]
MKKIVFGLVIVILLSGCTTRFIDFTIISSKNIDMSRGAEFYRDRNRVIGEDSASIIIFIPTGTPNAKEALDRAIESVQGAVALLDGVISQKFFYIPYIYGESTIIVEGTALIDPKLLSNIEEETTGKHYVIVMNKSGEIEKSTEVSEEDYKMISMKK